MSASSISERDIAALVQLHHDANAAWMVGDARRYLDLMNLGEDFTIMTPFGGQPGRGFDDSPERMERLKHYFRNGTFRMELVESYSSGDLAVLALIERSEAEVGGLPRQSWALRVTVVFRREAGTWRLVHRHADTLLGGISVEEAAAFARR